MEKKTGIYFDHKPSKRPAPEDLKWNVLRQKLPEPILEGNDAAIAAYWAAWELSFKNLRFPAPENGFVSPYFNLPFNDCIFMHDTATMTLYGKYAFRVLNVIESFNNFYVKQHENGEICREISAKNGLDIWQNTLGDPMMVVQGDLWLDGSGDPEKTRHYYWKRPTIDTHPPSHCSVDGLNDPSCFAFAEWQCYLLTGDYKRLFACLPVFIKYYEAFKVYLQDKNGLFITDWASMDNSPRNLFLGYGVDVASQMAFLARLISFTCRKAELIEEYAHYKQEAGQLAALISRKMWDPGREFFYCLDSGENFIPIKTIAGFMPLLAEACSSDQLTALIRQMNNPYTFKRKVLIPSLAANESDYTPLGHYYYGGCWDYANCYVTHGLELYNQKQLAHAIAKNFWSATVELFEKTGTFWEYLSPELVDSGKSINPVDSGKSARQDFIGFGTRPAIGALLEDIIGLRPNAPEKKLTWNVRELKAHGCNRYAFGDIVADLFCERRPTPELEPTVRVYTNRPFTLIVNWGINGTRTYNIE